jgi:dienelactone hydrolase
VILLPQNVHFGKLQSNIEKRGKVSDSSERSYQELTMASLRFAFMRDMLVGLLIAVGPTIAAGADDAGNDATKYFQRAEMLRPTLSRNGDAIAFLKRTAAGRWGLVVCDTQSPPNCKMLAADPEADIIAFEWINDRRLLGHIVDLEDDSSRTRLFAVDRDGTNFKSLADFGFLVAQSDLNKGSYRFMRTEEDDGDDIVLASSSSGVPPAKMNSRTGEMHLLYNGQVPEGANTWRLDDDDHVRIVGILTPEKRQWYYRSADGTDWQPFAATAAFQDREVTPVYIGTGDTILVRATNDHGFRALFQMKPGDVALPAEPILQLKGFDYESSLEYDPHVHRMLGSHFQTDSAGTVWFDKTMRDVQSKVDQLLPGTSNEISCGRCLSNTRFIVSAISDQYPTAFLLFDSSNGKLSPLGSVKPELSKTASGRRDFVRVKARDGQEIPLYITTPRAPKQGPWPTVVLLHDGPWERVAFGEWQPETAFLAAHGYLVLEPQFRGSTGFGENWQRAGYRQWGRGIQDDIEDATQWAVDQKLAKADAIGVLGGGFGGYASMMAMIKQPQTFRAGVDLIGTPEIADLFKRQWSSNRLSSLSYDPIMRVGDPDKDAVVLAANSPLENAARLTGPLLMVYFGHSRYANTGEGEQMRDALRAAGNQQVEWVLYKDEAIPFRLEADRIDFWQRSLDFFNEHLKPSAAAQ